MGRRGAGEGGGPMETDRSGEAEWMSELEVDEYRVAESPEPSEPSPEAKSQPHVNFNVKL